MQPNTSATTFHRLPKVRELCGGVAPSTVWNWVKQGLFAQPVKLSSNCTAWLQSDIEAWANARITGATDDEIRALVAQLAAARITSSK